jgi:DNA-nicking Smr family endonuclease
VKWPRGKGGSKEPPSQDDEIWSRLAVSIEPLKRRKGRVHHALSGARAAEPAARPVVKSEERTDVQTAKRDKPVRQTAPSYTRTKTPAPPQLAEFDRKSVRKIRGGRAEIEARVDLHGLHQDEAHHALRTFLMRCHSRGLRFVLVITGKGKAASAETSYLSERDRGVLKRNVPRWLEEPELRSIIVSFTTAAIRHGGEGALYVHLRSKDRS